MLSLTLGKLKSDLTAQTKLKINNPDPIAGAGVRGGAVEVVEKAAAKTRSAKSEYYPAAIDSQHKRQFPRIFPRFHPNHS